MCYIVLGNQQKLSDSSQNLLVSMNSIGLEFAVNTLQVHKTNTNSLNSLGFL